MSGRAWTELEIQFVTANYPDCRCEDIAKAMQRTPRAVYGMAAKLGLSKSAEFLASGVAGRLDGVRGGKARFKKGMTPWNKGKSHPATGRAVETQFKKGGMSGRAAALFQPIGSERFSKDGYLERKVTNEGIGSQRWRGVHLLVWEAANGPLPAGHAVIFKDGNKQHIALENLELVSRAELMRRNSVHRLPKELAELVQLTGALNRQINKREKA